VDRGVEGQGREEVGEKEKRRRGEERTGEKRKVLILKNASFFFKFPFCFLFFLRERERDFPIGEIERAGRETARVTLDTERERAGIGGERKRRERKLCTFCC